MKPIKALLMRTAAVVPVVSTTLDPNDTYNNLTLSNGNLTASGAAALFTSTAFGVHGKASGKWFFEVTINADTADNVGIGIAGALFLARGQNIGADATSAGWWSNTQASAPGDVIRIIVDIDAGKLWIRRNGTLLAGDPQAGTGGTDISALRKALYPAISIKGTDGQLTCNFGQAAWGSAAEVGYSAWDNAAQPVTYATWRSFAAVVRDVGNFAHTFAEWKVMASSGGATLLTGGTPSSSTGNPVYTPLSNGFDGLTTTYTGLSIPNAASSQSPCYFIYDRGSSSTVNATHLSFRGRDGGGGAEGQAPRRFDCYVSTDAVVYWKTGAGYTFSAFAATTPGELKELVL